MLNDYIRDLVAHKACPLPKKIACPALDHYSTVMVSYASPFTKDIFNVSETHLFTSFIIAYNRSFSYFTGGPARTHFKLD